MWARLSSSRSRPSVNLPSLSDPIELPSALAPLSEHSTTTVSYDTVVVLCSDNGASAEGSSIGSLNEGRFTLGLDRLEDNLAHIDEWGGFRLYNHYAWGWAWAGNTPFHLWKRYAWL